MSTRRGERRALAAALTATLLVAPSAQADRPTALAIDRNGITHVADSAGGRVSRLSASGARLTDFPARLPTLAGIDVGPDDHLWVLGDGGAVYEHDTDGRILRQVSVTPCTRAKAPTVNGGLDVSRDFVFVASPCGDDVVRLDRTTLSGRRAWTVDTPAGLSFNPFSSPHQLAVARSAPGEVRLFTKDGTATRTQPVGGQVADVHLDDFGVVAALDSQRAQLHFYGTDGVEFKTLGRPGTRLGDLDGPLDVDIFGQYGGDLAGNVFIADTGNTRVQRWDAGGGTFWATSTLFVDPPPGPVPPPDGEPPLPDPPPATPGDPAPDAASVGVSINAAALFTRSAGVAITVRVPAGATAVVLSNDGGFGAARRFAIAPSRTYSWTLQDSGPERLPKTVYMRFEGPGTTTATYTDDIILDRTAPVVNGAALSPTGRSVLVSARDATSGVARLQLAAGPRARRTTVRYQRGRRVAVPRSVGRRPVVRAIDRAGNAGAWKRVTKRAAAAR